MCLEGLSGTTKPSVSVADFQITIRTSPPAPEYEAEATAQVTAKFGYINSDLTASICDRIICSEF
jgi:hypothetical protein